MKYDVLCDIVSQLENNNLTKEEKTFILKKLLRKYLGSHPTRAKLHEFGFTINF